MTDEEFDAKGRELAEFFAEREMPFVLIAVDQSRPVNRNHCCSNIAHHDALEIMMQVLMGSNEPQGQPSEAVQ